MRENGVDMPDPDFSGGGGGCFRVGGGGVDPDSATFRRAQEACQEILEDALGRPARGSAADGDAGTSSDGGA